MAEPKITVEPPGPEARKVLERDDDAIITNTRTTPVVAESADGWLVEDVDGNRFLDFSSGIAVVNTGHCHPGVVDAVQDQAEDLMHFAGTDFYYDAQVSYAERLTELAPVPDGKVFYTNSGTEGTEASMKLARHNTGRPGFLAFRQCFHGRTFGSLSLTASKAEQRRGFQPLLAGVFHVPFPNPYRNPWDIDGYAEPDELTNRVLDRVEELFEGLAPPEDIAAFFAEPIQGEGGYVMPPEGFFGRLASLLDEHGILLGIDEVQTGFGRTGELFAADLFDVEPDLIWLAKGIASGLPMGAVVAREELDFPYKGAHSNTYGGNLVALSAAEATLDAIEDEDMLANTREVGDHMRERLEEIQAKHEPIGDVRGVGLMQAIDLVQDHETREPANQLQGKVVQGMFKRGVLVLPCGSSSIRFIPPLNVDRSSVDAAVEVLEETLKAV
ncbi:aspartate aminotransferase family protein [Thermoplasmatales archaeon SW_10_69_26]|nr:MAG: aspartate aminotransferase family protein [Thermoplasmatales archaeon SW_10_69_26]